MHDHLLADIGKSIVTAAALGFPAYMLKIPLLLAFLGAGVLLGPNLGFGVIQSSESISTLSEIGLVLLMFILGLEIDIRKLMRAGKPVLVNGLTQFTGCAIIATGLFWALGVSGKFGDYTLLYLAVACSLSSTLIAIKILSEKMELDTLTSRITVGILVLQDVWAIAFLAIQPNISNLNMASLGISLGKIIILGVSAWTCAKYILPFLFRKAGKQSELMLIVAMAWCFGMCGLADMLKLSLEMGSLVAGVSIASFPYHLDLAAKITSLRDFFVTLFFVGLGIQIPFPTAEILGLSAIIIVFVLVSRVLTVFPVLHKMKYGNRTSLIPALNLSQLSEFSLVLATLGTTYGHVRIELLYAFIIAMVVTALISSLIIPIGHDVYRLLTPFLERLGFVDDVTKTEDSSAEEPEHYSIVMLGFFRDASALLYEMQTNYSEQTFKKVLVVDLNPETNRKLEEMGVACRYGDISHLETLHHLHLEHSELFICSLPDSLLKGITNLSLLKNLRKLAPNAKIIVTAERLDLAKTMYDEGADYVIIPRMINAHYLIDVIEKMRSEGSAKIREGGMEYLDKRKEVLP